MTQVQDVSKFKMLTEHEHVISRPSRYVGSVNTIQKKDWVIIDGKVVEKELNFNPAFMKIFDEIITNSADHSRRAEGKHLKTIQVNVNRMLGTISVYDDGGIPVVEHPENKLWIPDMIFGHLRSGSNFNDDDGSSDDLSGQNGEGSSLTNIFSTEFIVETCDGKSQYKKVYRDNMSKSDKEIITPANGKKGYTRITYSPDFKRFGMVSLDDDTILLIQRRCYEVAATNTHLDVEFNGQKIVMDSFKDFVKLFGQDNVFQASDKWNLGLVLSEDGFNHVSFVNSTMTYEGGTHIEYVMDKVVEAVREHIEKKTKQKIKPSEIKSQFKLILDARIVKPRYSSQTKENLVTPPSMYGSVLTIEPKTVKDLVGSPMMKKIIEWAERRKIVEEMREASEKLEKSRSESFHHIEKYYPATAKDISKNILFVAEGDSALKPLRAAKKPIHGLFPLRGKPDNVFDKSIKYLADQVEFQNLVKIMGLDLSGKVDVAKLRYGSLVVATDADLDGIHIRGLLVVSFNRFWPELISKGVLKFLKTPVMTATVGKKVIEFFTPDDYEAWLKDNQNTKHSLKYYKGLGSWDTTNMDRFMNDPKYIYTVDKMDAEDIEKLNMAFDPQRAAARKLWLGLHV